MTSRLAAVTFDARDPALLGRFWSRVLDRPALRDDHGVLLPGSATQVGLRMVPSDEERTSPNRMHLHLTSTSQEDQAATVARLLTLGAAHLDVGQRPEDGHVVLADPEGNALCVIEADNRWLAGCGFLGEVACEGTRDVGLFWRDALRWPLVWDEDGETAVQAPSGGTKVAWGGPPVAPLHGRPRQRFELVTNDPAGEAERLTSLGARVLRSAPDGAMALTDPDGAEFAVVLGD
ncbi:VOC family protein [Kineosporia sp. R_H_3]|uniref:VOC family protein n=1 Tax=Kineosporia sp. R_H_3 TaxID=1961848 RepID=UPI000B4AD450|nr:VOC family protein [Kineosporia sp. R_H_3]